MGDPTPPSPEAVLGWITHIGKFMVRTDSNFRQIDARFDRVEQRLGSVESSLEEIKTMLAELAGRASAGQAMSSASRRGSRKFDQFRLLPDAQQIRAAGNEGQGWGVREGSKIKALLDAAEAAGPPGTILARANLPPVGDNYLSWLAREGYLEPVE